jgi:thiol-disulfide isomerase/thioredoxin
MIADGPSANRPPHIALELPVLLSRLLTVFALGLGLLAGGCDRETAPPAQPQPQVERRFAGSELPDFTFRDPAGKTLRLASLTGKPLLINLWATWCAPCVAELPALDRLAAASGGALKVLTVSQDMAQPEKIAGFLAERGVRQLEPWLDPDNSLAFHYKAEVLPTSILYDAQGREVWRFTGPREWGDEPTAKLLAEAR